MREALILAALGLLATGRWLWHLKRHPFGRCRRCGGTGQNTGSTRTRFGQCRRCKGQPRVRFGATLVHPELRERR